MKKTKLALGIAAATLTVAGVAVSQQAVAGTRAQHHATEAALVSKVDVLEAQLRAMQDEMSAIRASAGGGADSAKVQELDAWMQEHKNKPESRKFDNLLFFRGGYTKNDHSRSGVSIPDEARPLGIQPGDDEGFYIGAGFDFGLTDDVWGLMPNTEVLGELMLEWKDFGQATGVGVSSDGAGLGEPNIDGSPGVNATLKIQRVSVSQFSITASPKIKFMKGSKIRPWVIPVGLAFHVISPPSESITVFNPGMMFGAGADYNIWKSMYVGVDARYHLTSRSADGVNTDGFTAGGYVGLGF